MATQVAPALADPILLHGFRMRRAILPPVAGVIGAPLAGAFAAHLAILGIGDQFLFAAIGAAALLASWLGANGLLRMASGRFELL